MNNHFPLHFSHINTILPLEYQPLNFRYTYSFIHSRYFYSASSSSLLLRGTPDYSIDTVPELTRWSATGNCE